MTSAAPAVATPGSVGAAGATVVDDSGIRIGVADAHGQVRDFAGIHIGSVAAGRDGAVVDFAGIRIGHIARDHG